MICSVEWVKRHDPFSIGRPSSIDCEVNQLFHQLATLDLGNGFDFTSIDGVTSSNYPATSIKSDWNCSIETNSIGTDRWNEPMTDVNMNKYEFMQFQGLPAAEWRKCEAFFVWVASAAGTDGRSFGPTESLQPNSINPRREINDQSIEEINKKQPEAIKINSLKKKNR